MKSILAAIFLLAAPAAAQAALKVGDPAPDFTARRHIGRS